MQGKGLRDNFEKLTALGLKIYGVSLQDAASHQAFIEKYGFQFPLVVDDGTLAKAFGVPVKGEFASRQSFLIGDDGNVAAVWRNVNPAEHADEVLRALER